MSNISEKISYLKGLSDGLGIDHETKEGKMLLAIVDVLDEMGEEINILEENQNELDEYVDAIDEDLSKVEDDVYGDDDEEDEDDGYVEVECPNCHETVYLDEDMLDEEEPVLCPNCNEPIKFEESDGCCCHDNNCHEEE